MVDSPSDKPTSFSLLRNILTERRERIHDHGSVRARCMLGFTRKVSLGSGEAHYRISCEKQLLHLCLNKWNLRFEGLKNINRDLPQLFVMKHRGFSDITLHGFAYCWATSGLFLDQETPWENRNQFRQILRAGKYSRFVMKEDLLSLPFGLHLVLNGAIPVPQDLETKALNTPGFDPKSPKVLEQQKKMSTWFNFKDSYREIINTLKNKGAVMIYGEATRVHGDCMGHLSLKMIDRLRKVPDTKLIPVGSKLENGTMVVSYGTPCEINELRESIATLSNIPKERYI